MGKRDSISSQNSCLMGFVRIEKALLENDCLVGVTAGSGLWKERQFDLRHSPVGAGLRLLLPNCRREAQGLRGEAHRGSHAESHYRPGHKPGFQTVQKTYPTWPPGPTEDNCLAEVEMAVQDKKGEKSNMIQVIHRYKLMFHLFFSLFSIFKMSWIFFFFFFFYPWPRWVKTSFFFHRRKENEASVGRMREDL